jgi:hypothetical protein
MSESIGKYLSVEREDPGGHREVIGKVLNRRAEIIGTISWYTRWRCYTFIPSSLRPILNAECMSDIALFLRRENQSEQRARRRSKKEDPCRRTETPAST